MDHALALPIWDELDTGFIYFWLALAMMVAMAVSFLLAHAIIRLWWVHATSRRGLRNFGPCFTVPQLLRSFLLSSCTTPRGRLFPYTWTSIRVSGSKLPAGGSGGLGSSAKKLLEPQ